MSDFLNALKSRIELEAEITLSELSAVEEFINLKMPGYGLSKKRSVEKKETIPLGEDSPVPINPFSNFEYDDERYQKLWEWYADQDCCGQFATENQWNKAGRKCFGSPVMKGKLYGKEIFYFPYEQTEKL